MSAGVVQSDEQAKPHSLTYSVYNNSLPSRLFLLFRTLFFCPSQCSAKDLTIYFTDSGIVSYSIWESLKIEEKEEKMNKMPPVNFSKFVFKTISCLLLSDLWSSGYWKSQISKLLFPLISKIITAEFIFKGQVNMKSNGLLPRLFPRLLHTHDCSYELLNRVQTNKNRIL